MATVIPVSELKELIEKYKHQLSNASQFGGDYACGMDAQASNCIDDLNEIIKKYEK